MFQPDIGHDCHHRHELTPYDSFMFPNLDNRPWNNLTTHPSFRFPFDIPLFHQGLETGESSHLTVTMTTSSHTLSWEPLSVGNFTKALIIPRTALFLFDRSIKCLLRERLSVCSRRKPGLSSRQALTLQHLAAWGQPPRLWTYSEQPRESPRTAVPAAAHKRWSPDPDSTLFSVPHAIFLKAGAPLPGRRMARKGLMKQTVTRHKWPLITWTPRTRADDILSITEQGYWN